jgi:hypothetical protein
MAEARVTMAKPADAAAELEGWIELLYAARDGDAGAETDLYRLIAMHGRRLGQEGRPASAAILQPLLLEDTLEAELGVDHPFRSHVRELVKIVADAHALGQGERTENAHDKMLRTSSPVLRLGQRAVVGWLIGPLRPDTIDAVVGRLFAECAGAGAPMAILDLSTAGPPTDVFFRTVAGYSKSDVAKKYRLVITGVDETAREQIAALGADLSTFDVHERLYDVLPIDAP